MRESLFRGKRVDNDEWIEGSLWIDAGFPKILGPRNTFGYAVYPDTVGEYSGFHNKSGKQFVEGDIVRNRSKWNENIGVIVFRNGRFCVDWRICNRYSEKGLSIRTDDLCSDDEIIGNIHDNQELIR